MRLYCIFLYLIILGCKSENKGFTINGRISGEIPEYVFLKYDNKRDSSKVVNGNFIFNGKVDYVSSADIFIPPISSIDKLIYIENENINIQLSVKKISRETVELNYITIDSIQGTITSKIEKEFDKFESKNSSCKDWNHKLYKKLFKIIQKNSKNPYSADLLSRVLNNSSLTFNQVSELYEKLDKDNPAHFSVGSIKKYLKKSKELSIGGKLPHFKLPNSESTLVKTENFSGNIILIEFWASWCKPCRKKNAELINIYNKYKNKNFRVLGVSLDTDIIKWEEAIKEDKLPWENVIEKKGFNGNVPIQYDITYLPYNILVDSNYSIMGIDLELDEILEILDNNLFSSIN